MSANLQRTVHIVRAPSYAELQQRINLARSIIGHRSGPAGMTAEDVEDMRRALEGEAA